jgi:hypothetical protein
MKKTQPSRRRGAPQPEVQGGQQRSKARDEALKRLVKQHPQRDEPRVDSTEEEQPAAPDALRAPLGGT